MKLQDFRFLEDPRFRKERLMWIILTPLSLLLLGGVIFAFYLQQKEATEEESARREDSKPYVAPPEVPLTPEQQANQTVGDARTAYTEGRFEEARDLLAEVDLKSLHSTTAWELHGRLQAASGDKKAAVESFSEGLEIEPSPGLLFRRALVLRDLGNLDASLADLHQAVDKAPNDPVLSNEYYLLRIQMGQSEQVTTEIEAILAQTGTIGSERWVVALAGIFLERGDYAEGARFLALGKSALDSVAFKQLLDNPIILRHQGRPEVLPLYLQNL